MASFQVSWFFFFHNESLQIWLWVAMLTDPATSPPDLNSIAQFQLPQSLGLSANFQEGV